MKAEPGKWCNEDTTVTVEIVTPNGRSTTGGVVCWRGDGEVEVDTGSVRAVGVLAETWLRQERAS